MTENHREYETVFILDPTLDEAQEKEQVDRVVKWVQDLGGTMDNVERWGRRRLAYEIRKKRDGIYNILHYHAAGNHVKELERRMKLNESIMRVLTVVVDPRQKRKIEEARVAAEARAVYEAERLEAVAAAHNEARGDSPAPAVTPAGAAAEQPADTATDVGEEIEKPVETATPASGETAS